MKKQEEIKKFKNIVEYLSVEEPQPSYTTGFAESFLLSFLAMLMIVLGIYVMRFLLVGW